VTVAGALMKRIRRLAVLASAMVVLFAFAAVATVRPPAGFVDRRPQICGLNARLEDCFGGPVPYAWDQPPAIWFVLACAVTLVIAVGLWFAPVREDPTSDIPRR
jgi:hypothetical protein